MVGPAGLPRNVVGKLNESLAQALKAPDIAAKFASLNLEPMINSPDGFADFINKGIETWAQVLKRMNIKVD